MKLSRQRLFWIATVLCLLGMGLFLGVKLRASLPVLDGSRTLAGLEHVVEVTADRHGIPTIRAQSRLDALRALGYVSARDRLFQMDLLRRHSAGRLAEIFGKAALANDIEQRHLGFAHVAPAILAALPSAQQQALQAYTAGVNAFLGAMATPPLECLLLGYRPEPWTMTDSILVVLSMFQTLSSDEDGERMLTIMDAVLPPEVVAFLTPDTDRYSTALLPDGGARRPIRPIPINAMAALRRTPLHGYPQAAQQRHASTAAWGSNNWAVAHSRTADGRAILANDMHLALGVPNIFYRAVLHYGDIMMAGVLIPGIPVFVAGSNNHIAWGMTNSKSDVLDLVRLEINPANPAEYRSADGWQRFTVLPESIRVRGGGQVLHEVKRTIWGPVSSQPLLGQPVAIRWTALEPQAVDIGLLSLDAVTTLSAAVDVINALRGPPLNVLLADRRGHIAWTYSGRIPLRQGFDGATSVSWADGQHGWQGYIPPAALPRVIDPPAGFLVTANNRTIGKDYPYVLGHNFDYSYRAYRISEQLRAMHDVTEQDMLALQLDTTSRFYDFYQQLALAVLSPEAIATEPLLAEARQYIHAWTGRADVDSVGFTLLMQFRETLLTDVFAPFFVQCQEADVAFFYAWRNKETPLRLLLTARPPELLPTPNRFSTWEAFLRATLLASLQQLRRDYHATALAHLPWGRLNTAAIAHPLAGAMPLLGRLLNMPQEALPGCVYCVRTGATDWGAAERLVVSPGRHQDAILQMPGGQSGHPLSPHYSDQHAFWVQGMASPFLPGEALHTLLLEPAQQPPLAATP